MRWMHSFDETVNEKFSPPAAMRAGAGDGARAAGGAFRPDGNLSGWFSGVAAEELRAVFPADEKRRCCRFTGAGLFFILRRPQRAADRGFGGGDQHVRRIAGPSIGIAFAGQGGTVQLRQSMISLRISSST